jgi:post-segregation antitoxin (ccd killing protein)
MPRMHVYLPDDLYRAVKERDLPASELLQEAVAAELRRQALNEHADQYLADLIAEVGEPSARERTRAEAIARRVRERGARRRAG